MPQPQHQPTDETRLKVEVWAGVGVTHEVIASELDISADTLVKHYPDELKHGRERANAKVASVLYAKAIGGDTTSAIFWLKTRARWTETSKIEMTGDDGGPLKTRIEVVYTNDPTEAASLPSGPDTGPPRTETV